MLRGMREKFIDRFCAAFPQTERTIPFGRHTVIWTVRGHMFVAYMIGGAGLTVRVEDRQAAHALVAEGTAITVDYQRNGPWVLLSWRTPPDQLRAHVEKSYDILKRYGV
jgi:predicted DNA-binding protein (MmcQ/YjbR family)